MARMTPEEWRRQKASQEARQAQGTTSSPVASSGRMTPDEWKAQRSSASVDSWAKYSIELINDVKNNSNDWYDENEYQSRYDRFSIFLGQADSWRKQYAGNQEAVSYIDSVVSALTEAQKYSFNNRKFFSQWNTKEDYDASVRYNGYFNKYNGMSTEEIDTTLSGLVDGEEKEWLSSYKGQKEHEELLDYDTKAGQKEIEELEALLEEYDFLIPRQDVQNPNSEHNVRLREIRQKYGSKEDIKNLISEKNAYINRAKYIQDGASLSGVTGNADFNMHSGYVSTKTEGGWWDKARSTYGMGYDDLTYEYINGADNGMREEISRKAISYSSEVDPEQATAEWNIYDHMTETEISIYNYHYAKDGKDSAEKYLASIRETLNQRKATGSFENYDGNTAMELLFGVEAGVDQFKSGVKNLFNFKDNYIPVSSTQMLSGMVRENLKDNGPTLPDWLGGSSVGQAAYDTITTTANMAPSVLTSMVVGAINPVAGEIVGSSLMGASAAGNAYQEALNLGYNKGQARAYSTIIGASEAGLQYLLGGIGSMGGKASGEALSKMLSGIDNAFLRTAIKFGGNMLSEGFEEGLQEILTPLFKDWTLRAEEDVNWSEVAYSGLLGTLTAGFMEGPTTIAGEVNTYRTGKQLQAADISAARLAEIGKTFSADTVAYQLAGKVNENTGAYTLGRLFNEIGATLSEQNVFEITEALVAKGMDRKTAEKNAKALALVVEGGELSDRQAAAIEANDVLAEAARTTLIDPNTTWNQRTQGYNAALKMLADNVANQKASQTEQSRSVTENAPVAGNGDTNGEISAESRYEVAADGKTVRKSDGKTISIKGIASIEEGKIVLDTDSGAVNVNDVRFASNDEALVYEAVADLGHMIDADTANRLVQNFNKTDGVSALAYARGAAQAYTYGYYGYSRSEAARSSTMSSVLTDAQRNAAYTLGRLYRGKETAQKQKTVSSNKSPAGKKQGQVFFRKDNMETRSLRDYVKESGRVLEAVQETAIKTMEKLSSALGVDFYVYESYVKDGKRYYIDENGVEQEDAPNGWYDPKTGNIYIDLNAGNTGKGTMLFTVAHELTHFIRQWSPAKFKKLADFVFKHGGFKNRGAELVEAKMAKAEERGKPISYDTAYEEVVADGMESILTSGKVVEMMADIKRQDQSLWQKICNWFKNLADDLRAVVNAYRGYSPDSTEGQMVADMKSVIKQIEAIYTEGLVDASENFQTAEKNTTEDGGVKEQARPSVKTPDMLDPRSVTKDDVRKLLQDVEAGLYAENTYIPVRISTPGIVQERLFAEDLPMAMPVKKARQDFAKDLGPVVGKNVRGHELTVDDLLYIIEKLDSPDYLFSQADGRGIAVLFLPGHPNRKTVVVDFGQNINAAYMNGYDGGKYNISITAFDIDGGDVGLFMKQLEKGWNKVFDKQKEGDPAKKFQATRPFAIEQDTLDKSLTHKEDGVKNESVESLDVEVDAKTESAAPAVLKSERTWTESDYVQERETAAKEIADAIGVSVKKAKAYIDSVNSIAKMIADDRVRLDYFSSPGRSSFVSNVEYGGSFDFSTLCKKRRLLTGTFTAIQKALPNTALTANEILDIRNRMKEKGLEVSCGLCYVEGSRANMGQFAKEFLKLYKQYYPDAWQPNMADVNTPDGIEWVRINHPECYEQYEYFWNHYGTLKPGDKNLFASQQKPKLYQLHTEYKGEILSKFDDDDNVEEKNLNGGIRLQSFSDFEIVHLIDTMQIIMDMSRVGLAGQAYTKVPDFAWALGDTGLKINLSLIAKGIDENGRLIFDDVEGMPIDEAIKLRDRYSKNVGTILVAFNDEQLLAAMADERVDFIIPYHRSQWKKSQYTAMGLPAKTKDYTYMQNEKFIKPQYHEYRGRMVKDKATNYMPNEYWDFSKSGKENAEAYLEMCARNNKRPKFYKLLQNNGDGSYSLKADGSTDGYWKLLIDFKMYDNNGKGSPQLPVKPEFNMDEATRMLNEYRGGHSNFPVAQGIVDDFVKEYKANHQGVKHSERDYSYNALVSKPDMVVTEVGGKVPKNRADVAAEAKKNAAKVGKFDPKTGSVSVHVDDIDTDVILSTKGLRHGLRRTGDPLSMPNYIVTVKAGEILKNSIRINEITPSDDNAKSSYILIGAARDVNGTYVVRFVVNHFDNNVVAMDVLYAVNAKKELAATKSPRLAAAPLSVTSSTISIAELLDLVNQHFPDILPEDVLKHYGYDARPEGDLGADALYQERTDDSVSNRSLLANAFESVAQHAVEKQKLQEYKEKIEAISAEEAKFRKLNDQIKELSFAKGPRDMEKIRKLRDEAIKTGNRISNYDKILLRLEAAKPLQNILQREKKAAYNRAVQKGQEYRKKVIEGREKTVIRHKIQSVVKELNDLLLNESKTRHVPDSLKKAVAGALSIVNMDTADAEERAARYADLIAKEQAKTNPDQDKIDAYTVTMENILRQGEKMGAKLKELRDAYEEIQNSDDPDIANGYDQVISGSIKELAESIGNTSLKNMSIEQLSDVYDMYRMVLTRVRDANKALLDNIRESISKISTDVIREVKTAGGSHTYRATILDPVRQFLWNNLKPVYAMEYIGSSTLAKVFNNVRAGEDIWAKDVVEARAYYLDKSKKYGYDSWDFDKKYHFESASGIKFELSLEQILSLYAYAKREQAHDHLRLGGFVFDSNIETYKEIVEEKDGKEKDGKEKDGKVKRKRSILKYKVNTADAHQISPEILAEVIGNLTKEQIAFVDEMQEYLSSVMGAKGNEVTSKMYGVKLFKEKFYFPLKSAKQFMFEQNEVSGEVKIKNSGFTNKVVAKANNPVILSNFMDVWAGHVNDMSMYHAFTLPLEDFNRVFNYNSPKREGQNEVSVKGTIQSAYSPAAVHYVKNLITDLNGGARTDSTTGFINKMMGLFKKGAVFASMSVTIQQPSAIARAAALVDTKYFIGPKVDHKRHKVLWDEVKQYAPVAIIKEMGYFDTNMGKSTHDYICGKEYSRFSEKMKGLVVDSDYRDEVLSKAPALADEIAWCSIWEAVKRETKANNPGVDVRSDAFLRKAGERFTEVITKTQVYDSVLSRSGNMRSKDTGMKMATAFMAEPTTSINMITDALLQGKRGNRRYARKAIGAVIASQILNSILVSFVYAGRDDDEEETYAEKYIGTFTGQMIDSLNPATYIPFIKDIVSIVQGYDVERSDMAVISDFWKACENLKNDKMSTYRKVENFVGSIAQIFGLPVKNLMRDARGMYQTIDSFVNGEHTTKAGIGYAVKSALPAWMDGGDVSNQNQLYEAMLRGDKAQIARVKGRFEDESADVSAVRTAIKERYEAGEIDYDTAMQYLVRYGGMEEDEAFWKAEEWKYESGSDDDFSKYNEFYESVQTGKNLKMVIKKYTDNGVSEDTLKEQISSHFKPLYIEMSSSEKTGIKGYLLNAITMLGYTREDAEKKIGEWEFEGKYGFAYSDRGDAYKNGDISASELKNILMTVGGKTASEANLQIQVYDWQMEGFDISDNAKGIIEGYESCETAGITKETYYNFYQFYSESGEEGVRNSKVDECMPYINSLPLTAYQKDAIALSIWAESTVRKNKLW